MKQKLLMLIFVVCLGYGLPFSVVAISSGYILSAVAIYATIIASFYLMLKARED